MTLLFYCYYSVVLAVTTIFFIVAHKSLGNGLTVKFITIDSTEVSRKNNIDSVAIAIAIILFGYYFAIAVPGSFFFNPDEWLILTPIFQGGHYKAGIWPSAGRFFPLANQEINIIAKFSESAVVLQSIVLLNFLLNVLIFWKLFPDITARWKVWPATLFLVSPSIFCASQSFIYSERLVITFTLLFIYLTKKYTESKNYKYGLLALTCAWSSMFYKEPVFLIYFGVSISAIINNIFSHQHTGKQTIKDCWYLFLILFLVGCFVAGYLFFIPLNTNTTYAQKMAVGFLPALSFYIKNDLIFIIFIILFPMRTIFLIKENMMNIFFLDFIGFGVFISYIFYILLQIKQNYYFAYLDSLAIVYLLNLLFVIYNYKIYKNWSKKSLSIAFPLLILSSLKLDTQIYDYYHQAAFSYKELTSFLVNYFKIGNEEVDIHLDTINISQVIGFIRTLEYYGVPVRKVAAREGRKDVKINVQNEVKGGFCEIGKPWLCIQSKLPKPGDLVIIYFYSRNQDSMLKKYLEDNMSYKLIFSSNKEIHHSSGPAAYIFKKII